MILLRAAKIGVLRLLLKIPWDEERALPAQPPGVNALLMFLVLEEDRSFRSFWIATRHSGIAPCVQVCEGIEE
jgi:hypothetical protein